MLLVVEDEVVLGVVLVAKFLKLVYHLITVLIAKKETILKLCRDFSVVGNYVSFRNLIINFFTIYNLKSFNFPEDKFDAVIKVALILMLMTKSDNKKHSKLITFPSQIL